MHKDYITFCLFSNSVTALMLYTVYSTAFYASTLFCVVAGHCGALVHPDGSYTVVGDCTAV